MRRAAFFSALALTLVTVVPSAQQPAALVARDLVGTWTLESTEVPGAAQPTRVPNPRGLLIFDSAGHVFETVTRATRRQADGVEPRLTDQQLAFAMYSGYWGRYNADPVKKTYTYQAEGAFSPNVQGRSYTRSFEFTRDRLVVTAAAGEPHIAAGTKWTWERVPPVDGLGPTYRRVVGFWQHVVEKRMNLTTGATLSETRRAPSIIVYSPSGYVGVHFPPLNRQPFAGAAPTETEARAAIRGYVGYFGALAVYPNMVFHQVLNGISPAAGQTLKRPLELNADGSEVTIKFPPGTNQQGQQTSTWVTLRRLSGEESMLPKR